MDRQVTRATGRGFRAWGDRGPLSKTGSPRRRTGQSTASPARQPSPQCEIGKSANQTPTRFGNPISKTRSGSTTRGPRTVRAGTRWKCALGSRRLTTCV